ncbi:MAG: isoleucine--tRNA ligase [Oligoflexia bacterium]|nr:isoleucine--tRNA ligase [Oligoflexia bacterium]
MSADSFRDSLLLPKTDFPMKAQLSKKEPEIVKQWREKKLYEKILEKRKSAELFFMPDGPPYANGAIHLGHVLNKILKDIVIKYKNLSGKKAPFIPSWDCHGLPIELEALKKQDQTEELSPKKLREECRKTARFWIEKQKESFERLGVLADWGQPLLTMNPHYTAEEVRAFAKLVRKGLIFSGTKPVFWCFKLQTALAFSEAEYREHKSPSIYVKFNLTSSSLKKLNSPQPVSAVIWTTTPWTLPANTAIGLHPDLDYGLFAGETESYLLAMALADSFFKETDQTPFKLEKTFKGKDLEFLTYCHPFLKRESPFVLGDHVSQETGTGLVHTAPGHGLEDYAVGQKYKLPSPCPVDERGHFTDEASKNLQGLFIFKGNSVILEMLKKTGHLLAHKTITHSYPYNPRSDSPLIYRLTAQWFLSLDKKDNGVRDLALKACDKEIHFVPSWGKARLTAMIQASPDWCLSRQRVWGVPLVVFYCKKCSTALLDPSVIEEIADEMQNTEEGIEYYFEREAKELLPDQSQCENCGHREFEKGEDILDVWFDSGVQHEVFSQQKEIKTPMDLFLEGSDQHRGWFQTSLLSSLALNSQTPFKTLLTHGFVNDNKGYKMSKSKGNVLNPAQLIEKNGAEILRIWTASENFAFDVKAGEENFKRVVESYRRFRNSFRFVLGNLNDFQAKELIEFKQLRAVDQWMLGQLNELIEESAKAYEEYAFYKVYQQLNHFFTVQMSAFYLDIIKDRLYTFPQKSLERRQAQTVLYYLMDQLLPLMAPITSFLSEEAYTYFNREKKDSVFLEDFPKKNPEWDHPEARGLFSKLFPLREELNKKLEVLRQKGSLGSNLQAFASLVLKKDFISPVLSRSEQLEFFSVSQIEIQEGEETLLKAGLAQGEKCQRCWFISEHLNEQRICPKCVKNLS